MKASSIGGSILVLIALIIALVEGLIAFVGFVTIAIKILIVVAFLALIIGVGFLVYKAWKEKRRSAV